MQAPPSTPTATIWPRLLAVAVLAHAHGALGQCSSRGMCSSDSTCIISCSCHSCGAGHVCSGGSWSNGAGFCSDVRYSCGAGTYNPNSYSHSTSDCIPCPAGQYQDSTGSADCKTCPSGKYTGNPYICVSCSSGRYAGAGYTACHDCSAGRYASSSGWSSCSYCQGGQYTSATRSTSCQYCGSGQYSSAGASSCSTCSPGQYTASSTASRCSDCSPGTYQPSAGQAACISCPSGTANPFAGMHGQESTSCGNCSVGTYAGLGSPRCTPCANGTWDDDRSPLTRCTACPLGFFGLGGNASCSSCTPVNGSCTITSCDHPATADEDYNPATPCTTCSPGTHPPPNSTECGIVDPCFESMADCYEAHPAAVCALPVCDGDDDAALLALPSAGIFLRTLSFPSCRTCSCLAEHELCEELARSWRDRSILKDACGCSCAAPRLLEERQCTAARLPSPPWREGGPTDTLDDRTTCGMIQFNQANLCVEAENDCAPSETCTYAGPGIHTCVVCVGPASSRHTPADEYPSVRSVCEAGLDAVVQHTVGWLNLALDYQLQAAEGNAGVVATQLCLERRYETLFCLFRSEGGAEETCIDSPTWSASAGDFPCSTYIDDGSRTSNHRYCSADADDRGVLAAVACPAACGVCVPQGDTSPARVLVDLHDQACELAKQIGLGSNVDTLQSSTDVPPLSLRTYHDTFSAVQAFSDTLRDDFNSLEQMRDLRMVLAQQVRAGSTDAVDEQGLWQDKVAASESRMAVYRDQLKDIDGRLQQAMQAMQIDGQSLLQSVSAQINNQQRGFQASVSTAALRSTERVALEQSVADIRAQQTALGRQIASLLPSEERDRQRLEHQLQALNQRQSSNQQRLGDSASGTERMPGEPLCNERCGLAQQPSSNGCGNDFTGAFHSWAMMALQDVTGCESVPYVLNDMSSCCDEHDLCYGTCGMSQAFCDQQLRQCMQSQASLPGCQTTIDISSLVVGALGCSYYTDAQDETVAAQCHFSDANHGCVSSCVQSGTCIEQAEQVCSAVAAIAGAVVASPLAFIPGVAPVAVAVEEVAEVAGYGLSVVEQGWGYVGSWFGRRLQSDCAGLDARACQELQERHAALQEKLQGARQLLATASSLAALNTQLLSDEDIDSSAIAKLDMSFLDLDLLNDQALVDCFRHALGSSAAEYETELRQVVTLLRSKLEQTRSYYQAAVSKHENQHQRDLLGRRASRANALAEEEENVAAQLAVSQDFFDAKLRAYAHLGLQYVVSEAKAYEYLFLQPYTGLDLADLRRNRMTGIEYQRWVSSAEADLQAAFVSEASRFNNGGGSCFSSTTFELADLPAASASFVNTGEITLSIALPQDTSYYGVTFSDVRAYLVGLHAEAGRQASVTIDLTKAGTSVFQDQYGQEQRFTHDETNPAIRFSYDPTDCSHRSESDGRLQSGNMEDIYVRYSPYGTWKLQVVDGVARLADVVAIRFEFSLQFRPGSFADRRAIFFETGEGCTGDLGTTACLTEHTQPVVPPPPVAPPPPALVGPPQSGEPCSTFEEFGQYSEAVDLACCTEDSPCVQGLPTACSASCAATLLPMQTACHDFISVVSFLRAGIESAVATCPTPAPPCATMSEFTEYTQEVTAACCSDDSPCRAGLPTQCSPQCADVLLPMERQCSDFLAALGFGMQETIAEAAAQCGQGH